MDLILSIDRKSRFSWVRKLVGTGKSSSSTTDTASTGSDGGSSLSQSSGRRQTSSRVTGRKAAVQRRGIGWSEDELRRGHRNPSIRQSGAIRSISNGQRRQSPQSGDGIAEIESLKAYSGASSFALSLSPAPTTTSSLTPLYRYRREEDDEDDEIEHEDDEDLGSMTNSTEQTSETIINGQTDRSNYSEGSMNGDVEDDQVSVPRSVVSSQSPYRSRSWSGSSAGSRTPYGEYILSESDYGGLIYGNTLMSAGFGLGGSTNRTFRSAGSTVLSTSTATSMRSTSMFSTDSSSLVTIPSLAPPVRAGYLQTTGGPSREGGAYDSASVVTLASSSKRRRRSVDTNASTQALAPKSLFGDSRESLPLTIATGGTGGTSWHARGGRSDGGDLGNENESDGDITDEDVSSTTHSGNNMDERSDEGSKENPSEVQQGL
ncbi:uncharacterized protein V1516DRAFT_673196 [Lipomyces oligophaga]|uniref:uncharacterized protein n=1 Tax=Lipomyces oligophaga TaxID=45792 RepID=UPI0034CD5123